MTLLNGLNKKQAKGLYKIVSVGICGTGERYLSQSLKHRFLLADEVIIAGNRLTLEEKKLIRATKAVFYEDNREWGKYQPRMKEDLVKLAIERKADWVLFHDFDEFFDKTFSKKEAIKLAEKQGTGYNFYIVNLWNDEHHWRPDLSFFNVRFFNCRYGWQFVNRPLGCGLAPEIAARWANYAPFLVFHYGLMLKEDREKKIARQQKYDPQMKLHSPLYYQALQQDILPEKLDWLKIKEKVAEEIKGYKHKIPKIMAERKIQYTVVKITKNNGQELLRTVPSEHVEILQKAYKKVEVISEIKKREPEPQVVEEKKERTEDSSLECPECGFVAKSERGLKFHAKKHQ